MTKPEVKKPARWAVAAAYGAVVSVLPSGLWRSSIGFGATWGTTPAWRAFQHLPGSGTVYVLFLTFASLGAALLTFGLVKPWGETAPTWVPLVGGKTIPSWVPVTAGLVGSVIVMVIGVESVVHWDHIIGFKGRPVGGWYWLAVGCYLPGLLWGPCVLVATMDYWRRSQKPAHGGRRGRA